MLELSPEVHIFAYNCMFCRYFYMFLHISSFIQIAYKYHACIYSVMKFDHIIHMGHILHILHITIFVMFIDCHIVVSLLVTLRTTNDSTRRRKHCLLTLLSRHIPPLRTCRYPRHSQPCRARHAQGDACCRRA